MEFWLVGLMRAFYIATTLLFIIAWIASHRLRTVYGVVMVLSKRGKTMQPSSDKFTVPQRFFSHFYVVAVVWTTFLLLMTWMYACKMAPSSVSDPSVIWCTVNLLLLMEVHVLRRLFESFYVFKYSPNARMHILLYLSSLFYYVVAPLSLCCSLAPEVFEFIVVKGGENDQMAASEFEWWELVNPLTMKLGWLQWIGDAVFLWGWIHQRRCHAVLGSLREHPKQINEHVIYAGLLIASGGTDLTIWLLFGIVVTNLAFSAADTQRWYLQKFDNYPSNRRVIIPFVY
ncbi:hypothetical protein ACOSQ2_005974 [Xanthoceras sorbifolium]